MKLIRIDKNSIFFKKAYSLYERSFCYEERRDAAELDRIIGNENYNFCVIDDNGFVGIMLYWRFGEIIYLEHFAVAEELRNNGYGKRALDILKKFEKQIVLEIEIPVDTDKKRRMDFYLRNGFKLNSHYHIQPKYHYGDSDLRLLIMSTEKELTKEEYNALYINMKKYVEIHY